MGAGTQVVVLNWNGRGYVGDCLRSLLHQTHADVGVIVVDNGSTDGSVDFIRAEFPEARLVPLPENRHFARGTNAGVEAALQDPACRFVVTLNNDTKVDPEFVSELVRAAEPSRVAMVAAKLLFMDRPRVLNSTGLLIGRDGGSRDRGWNEPDDGRYDQATDIFGPSAGAALYRREAMEQVGLFDGDFVAYYEDVDLAWRMRLAGWQARFAPRSVVYHKYSASGGAHSSWRQYMFARNRTWNVIQNYPWPHAVLGPAWDALSLASPFLRRGDGTDAAEGSPSLAEKVRAQARGRLDGWAGLRRALAKRRVRQASRTVDTAAMGHWLREYGVPLHALA